MFMLMLVSAVAYTQYVYVYADTYTYLDTAVDCSVDGYVTFDADVDACVLLGLMLW